MATCNASIAFGDDYGDNSCTFHCQLEEGHTEKPGGSPHKEGGELYGQGYIVVWVGERDPATKMPDEDTPEDAIQGNVVA